MKIFLSFIFISIFLSNNLDSIRLLIDGQFKRALILSLKKEDWRVKINNEKIKVNNSWINIAKKHKLIAHKLGDYSSPNTLQAAINSHKLGIKFMEVDLINDNNNNICLLENKGIQNCNFNNLLEFIAQNDIYLIIDFKNSTFNSSIRSTLNLIESLSNPKKISKQIIFQLYKPQDIETFFEVNIEKNYYFNLPIVTLYRSHSTFNNFRHKKPKFLKAITIPIARKNEIRNSGDIEDLLLMTHPIKNCRDFQIASNYSFKLVYGPNNLKKCKGI